MKNYDTLEELRKLRDLRIEIHDKERILLAEYLDDNEYADFREVIKDIASINKVLAYKICYDYLGGTLRTSMTHVNWILNR